MGEKLFNARPSSRRGRNHCAVSPRSRRRRSSFLRPGLYDEPSFVIMGRFRTTPQPDAWRRGRVPWPWHISRWRPATWGGRRCSSKSTLGWRPIARPNNIGRPAAWLTIAPGVELHLIEDPEYEPSPFEREFGRHVAVTVPLAEFPALRERLQARGATLIEPPAPDPVPAVLLPRPRGIRLRGRGRRTRANPGRLLEARWVE